MSNDDRGNVGDDPNKAGGENRPAHIAKRSAIHIDEIKANVRKKTEDHAKAEGMSIKRFEEVEEAIGEGRDDSFTAEEREAVERVQATLKAKTLEQLQRVISTPWMNSAVANNFIKNALGPQMSTVMGAFGSPLASKKALSVLKSSLTGGFPEHLRLGLTLPPETLAAFHGANVSNAVFLQSINPIAATFSRIAGDLQNMARASLTADFATRTQAFLTTDRDLRYRWNRPVWHYTNGHALLSILKNGQLWASSPEHLNDASEMVHGLEIIQHAFKDAVNGRKEEETAKGSEWKPVEATLSEVLDDHYFTSIINDVYYISASTEPDSLTLWRNYADGDGFALGIDTAIELSADGIPVDEEEARENIRGDVPLISGWYRVKYKPREKQRLAATFIRNAVEDIKNTDDTDLPDLVRELRKQAVILASVMKHHAFEDEREVRWMTTNFTTFDPVRYEHGRKSIVPVLHIMAASTEEYDPLPLRGLRCSPISSDSIVRTTQGLLEQRGYGAASKNITKSQQPFKG